ncbi:MAG: UV DNA damage repair endonuclease UvsE [Tissierellia bacterium]|nr:UV DNA damage repair endonuclease UvsE [Tissierellia bacterium]
MLGFACICKSLNENGKFRTITVKSASKLSDKERLNRLKSIAVDNLYNTLKILKWCVANNIHMYRCSSDLIPLATHDLGNWAWWDDKDIINMCNQIKSFAEVNNIRLSMHPDQFVVINSDKFKVLESSIINLVYHNKLSEMIGNNTLVLHVGGVNGNKVTAIERFMTNFKLLPTNIKSKIVLENDDKSFSITDVLYICKTLNIPMVLDLHYCKCYNNNEDIYELRQDIINTWNGRKPKVHISSGKDFITDRSHAGYIAVEDYNCVLEFCKNDFDIMVESKEKDLAILKLRK